MSLITYLTRIHFADGVLEDALQAELERCGVRKPLVVADPGVKAAGLLDRALTGLPNGVAAEVYDETPANPHERAVDAAAARYEAADCDGVIAIGGGSALDLGRAAALLVSHGGPLLSYAMVEGGAARIKPILPPLICIPTTAGTGSEVGRGALITFDDGRKLGIISPHLIASAAICDPTLTLSLPKGLTAGSGMDAITHCVETYIASAWNPPADGIALDGLRRGAAHIERAVADGGDIEARREMMAAAMNGALAFQKGLGGVHAVSHALGGLPGRSLHHGALNAVLLPHILRFNAPAAGHRYPALLAEMGLADDADLADAIAALNGRIGLPARLRDMDVDAAELDVAAPLAERDHTNGTNPRRAVAADYRAVMEAAF